MNTQYAASDTAVLGQPVVDPADWTAHDLERRKDWLYQVTPKEASALIKLAEQIKPKLNGDPSQLLKLSKATFDLGAFTKTFASLRRQLSAGLGFALIRGLPTEGLDKLSMAIIYWALGQHLGKARSNNPDGDLIGHVTDLGKTQADPKSRGYQTREAMDYHCDQSSIVGLLCIRRAKVGGTSKIASSVSVYNTLLERSPESVSLLAQPLCWTKHGEANEGEVGFYRSPVFNFLAGRLCVAFGPRHIVKGHALPGAPKLTPSQLRALALCEEIAEEQHFEMDFRPGDAQFLNNYVVLHTRTAYTDWPEADRRRLLWRLWLLDPSIRPATDYVRQWSAGVRLEKTVERIVL